MAAHIGEWARRGLLNIVGDAAAPRLRTSQHSRTSSGVAPAPSPGGALLRLSGLEPMAVGPNRTS